MDGINDDHGTDDLCAGSGNRGLPHVPVWESAQVNHDSLDKIYVDVTCKWCGRSGCLAAIDKDADEIDW